MIPILTLPIAYLLGAIPFGYLLVKLTTGADVRQSGSGNIGATNVLRTTGRLAAIATLLLDLAKGYAAVWIVARLTDNDLFWMSAAVLAVMGGHAYSIFLGFKGGKAVASFVGAFAAITPWAILAALAVFIGVVIWTRHISLGSIVAAATFPLAVWLLEKPPLVVVIAAVLGCAFIIYRHRSNIRRLREGTEHVFTFGSRNG